jgi:hypothetical protein
MLKMILYLFIFQFCIISIHSNVHQLSQDSELTGFEHCHIIFIQWLTSKDFPNAITTQLERGWESVPITRINLAGNGFVVRAALYYLKDRWWKRKETCQVVYMLNLDWDKEYCKTQKTFKWLVDCDSRDVKSICYSHYTYYIWVSAHLDESRISFQARTDFCRGSQFLDQFSSFDLPFYDLLIFNDTIRIITKLVYTCRGATLETTLKMDQAREAYGRKLLPHRILFDELVTELLLRACPIEWKLMGEMRVYENSVVTSGKASNPAGVGQLKRTR